MVWERTAPGFLLIAAGPSRTRDAVGSWALWDIGSGNGTPDRNASECHDGTEKCRDGTVLGYTHGYVTSLLAKFGPGEAEETEMHVQDESG